MWARYSASSSSSSEPHNADKSNMKQDMQLQVIMCYIGVPKKTEKLFQEVVHDASP